jgi:hypothetical protein
LQALVARIKTSESRQAATDLADGAGPARRASMRAAAE